MLRDIANVSSYVWVEGMLLFLIINGIQEMIGDRRLPFGIRLVGFLATVVSGTAFLVFLIATALSIAVR